MIFQGTTLDKNRQQRINTSQKQRLFFSKIPALIIFQIMIVLTINGNIVLHYCQGIFYFQYPAQIIGHDIMLAGTSVFVVINHNPRIRFKGKKMVGVS